MSRYYFCILFFFAFSVLSEQVKVTGVYSDLHYDEYTGDVLGTEIIIGYSSRGYWAMYQESEGEPIIPVIIPVVVSNNMIAFELPSPISEQGEFRGEILKTGRLVGKFKINNRKLTLKRGNSYWQ